MDKYKKNNKKNISGWGLYPTFKTEVIEPKSLKELINCLTHNSAITRGNGRSYGDCAVNKRNTISMKSLNRILSFNSQTGELIAEAGLLICDIIKIFLSRGWFLNVVPGSKYVTLGGAASADVHGKNHHKNSSFYGCINWLEILNNKGKLIKCSSYENSELFDWTIGGMGLTGIIYKISINLKKISTGWINQKILLGNNIDETINIFEKNFSAEYSVAWLDFSRSTSKKLKSIVMLGEHAHTNQIPKNLIRFPSLKKPRKLGFLLIFFSYFLNNLFISIFNFFYFYFNKLSKKKIVSVDNFFFPLDSIEDWNKIYGKDGFFQFQCIFSLKNSSKGLNCINDKIQNSKLIPTLAVLKRMGKGRGYFSFPIEGYTLTLDFPRNLKTLKLVQDLEKIVIKYSGNVYLAKDSTLTEVRFKKLKSNLRAFTNFKKKKRFNFSSVMSDRLKI